MVIGLKWNGIDGYWLIVEWDRWLLAYSGIG